MTMNFFSTSPIFALNKVLVTYPITSDILFSTSPTFILKEELVSHPLVPGILFWPSVIFVFKTVLVIKIAMSGILFIKTFYFPSKPCLRALYFDSLRTSLLTASLDFSKSIRPVFNLSIIYFTFQTV